LSSLGVNSSQAGWAGNTYFVRPLKTFTRRGCSFIYITWTGFHLIPWNCVHMAMGRGEFLTKIFDSRWSIPFIFPKGPAIYVCEWSYFGFDEFSFI